MYHTTQQITHATARIWDEQTIEISCWLNGAEGTAPMEVKIRTSERTIDLVSINPLGKRREDFADTLSDIREFFHIGYGNSFYKEAIGLFTNEI